MTVKVYFDENGSYPGAETLLNTYTYTFYWSTLTLAMMGDVPHPTTVFEYILMMGDVPHPTTVFEHTIMMGDVPHPTTVFEYIAHDGRRTTPDHRLRAHPHDG